MGIKQNIGGLIRKLTKKIEKIQKKSRKINEKLI
jgi:hypothetical protein